MKYICLGYFDEEKWEAMTKNMQQAFLDEYLAYDTPEQELIYGAGGARVSSRTASF
jgi:hypothetical protein